MREKKELNLILMDVSCVSLFCLQVFNINNYFQLYNELVKENQMFENFPQIFDQTISPEDISITIF